MFEKFNCHLKNIKAILVIILLLCNFHFLPILAQSRHGKPLSQNTIISLTSKKGILYNGIDNLMQLDQSELFEYDTLLLFTNNGYIIKDTLNRYLCYPEKVGTLWLTINSVLNNDTSMVGFKYFSVENIPDPLLTLNDQPIETPITLSKASLHNCDSLGIFFSDDIAGSEYWMTITEFSLGYSYGGFYVSHNNPGNKFSSTTKNIISRLGPEREISIRPFVLSEGKVFKQLPIYRIKIY